MSEEGLLSSDILTQETEGIMSEGGHLNSDILTPTGDTTSEEGPLNSGIPANQEMGEGGRLSSLLKYTQRRLAETKRSNPFVYATATIANRLLGYASVNPKTFLFLIFLAFLSIIPSCMDAGGRNPAHANLRTPPRWGPEMESSYSFRAFAFDCMIWCITTDMQPHRQCAAILQGLSGSARYGEDYAL